MPLVIPSFLLNTNTSFSPVDDYIMSIGSLAKAYLFKVFLLFPVDISAPMPTQKLACFAKSTTLPDTVLEETSTYFMGQQYKIPSARRFTDWLVTLYIDKDSAILNSFYEWSRLFHTIDNTYATDPKDFMKDQTIVLLDPNTTEQSYTIQYILRYAWPKSVANVALDYQNNEFLTVDITFSYQWHEII